MYSRPAFAGVYFRGRQDSLPRHGIFTECSPGRHSAPYTRATPPESGGSSGPHSVPPTRTPRSPRRPDPKIRRCSGCLHAPSPASSGSAGCPGKPASPAGCAGGTLPRVHQRRSASRAAVDPRLVIRNENDQVALRSPLVQQLQRSAAVGSASADRRQTLRRWSSRVARIQIQPEPRSAQTAAPRPTDSSAESTPPPAPPRRCTAPPSSRPTVTRHRALHRARNVRANNDRAFDRRDIRDRQFHRILQCIAHDARNAADRSS